jgi:hypothetical protein
METLNAASSTALGIGTEVVPARARKTRDKAEVEVEVGVQGVACWTLAALRQRQFFSLDELNRAIAVLLDRLSASPFKKLPGPCPTVFDALDQSVLRPLPEQPCVYAEWKKARGHIDYHVEVDGHYDAAPYPLVRSNWRCA